MFLDEHVKVLWIMRLCDVPFLWLLTYGVAMKLRAARFGKRACGIGIRVDDCSVLGEGGACRHRKSLFM